MLATRAALLVGIDAIVLDVRAGPMITSTLSSVMNFLTIWTAAVGLPPSSRTRKLTGVPAILSGKVANAFL